MLKVRAENLRNVPLVGQFAQPIKFTAVAFSLLFGLYYARQMLSGQAVE